MDAEVTGAEVVLNTTDTGATGTRLISVSVIPSVDPGAVTPSPVANSVIIDPRTAGLVEEFTLPSALSATAWPDPLKLIVKIPGETGCTGIETAGVVCPPVFSTTLAVVAPAIS